MPTYIDGEIPVGSVQSGELVLRNVVIETAVPYKPPVDGGIRSGIRDEYVPDGTERMILFDGNMQLLTADVEDGKKFLADGWQLVGMFDRASAERIAEKIASNPPPDNRVMMAKKNQKRLFGMGVLATMLPVAKMNLLAQREIKLEQKIALGMAKPAEPAKDAALAKAVSAEAAKAQTTAATIAQQISNVLADSPSSSPRKLSFFRLVSMNRPLNLDEWRRAIGDSGAGWYGWAGGAYDKPDSKASEIRAYVTGYKTGSDVNDVFYISQKILPIVSKELGTEIRVAGPTQSYEGSPQFRDFVMNSR